MGRPSLPRGPLMAMLALLGCCAPLSRASQDDFVFQFKAECQFVNGSQQVRFLNRWVYNRQQFVHFDSDRGYFVADMEAGEPSAKKWNSDPAILEQTRAQVDSFCRHNYGVMEGFMEQRRLKPLVRVSVSKTEDPKKPHQLTCNVNGFYPYDITVHWFKNGQQDPGVVSSELLYNGDWTGQIMVILETDIQKGDRFVCVVEHASLVTPYHAEWKLETSESARSKMMTGVVGFVLGGIFFTVGLIIYLKNKKGSRQFISYQPEEVDIMNH
ncbi:SLA class II histocompatibility antigen, DQ haplotype C beta chain-like [Lissotriton helveticus]